MRAVSGQRRTVDCGVCNQSCAEKREINVETETKKLLTFAVGFGILLKLSLRDKRKTEKFGLEPIEVLKKNLKKVLDKRFWF